MMLPLKLKRQRRFPSHACSGEWRAANCASHTRQPAPRRCEQCAMHLPQTAVWRTSGGGSTVHVPSGWPYLHGNTDEQGWQQKAHERVLNTRRGVAKRRRHCPGAPVCGVSHMRERTNPAMQPR
eukprot:56164-Chlamydomonas_euryale.AAC.12